jgi:hypothetical protein
MYHIQQPVKGTIMKNIIIQIILSLFLIMSCAFGINNFEKEIENGATYFCENNICGFEFSGKQFDDKKILDIIKKSSVKPDTVRSLYFIETTFSGNETDIIREFSKLEKVVIDRSPISDKGLLNCFGAMIKLKSFAIPYTFCSENSLIEILKNNPQLEELNINGCPVDVGILPFLLKLKKLKRLNMIGKQIMFDTFQNVQKLKKALPDCEINSMHTLAPRDDESEINEISKLWENPVEETVEETGTTIKN